MMQRGDIWIATGNDGFSGKPAPFVIVQRSLAIPMRQSIIVCRVTSVLDDATLFRLRIEPSQENELEKPSSISVDKVLTLKKSNLTHRIGRIADIEMQNLDHLLRFWLGL